MLERISAMLDKSDLACYIVAGISIAAAVLFAVGTVIAFVCACVISAWWLLGALVCGLLSGVTAGMCAYIFGEYF